MKFVILLVLWALFQVVTSQGYVNPLKRAVNKGLNKEDENPAVKVRLTAKGMNYAASIAAEMIAKKVSQTKIDNISGKKGVKYSVKNIKIDSFRKPDTDISMIPGHGIRLNFRNAALTASGRWKYRKHFIKDSGSVNVYSNAISIDVSVNIIVDSNGSPKLKAHSCKVNLGGFNIKLHGGASFLYNLIFKAFKGKAMSKIEQSICDGATDAININGNNQLAKLNKHSKISEGLVLDYSLTGPVTFSGTYFETSHKGMFLEDPEKPKIPLIGTSSSTMIGFSIAAEAFNSAGRVVFHKKLILKDFKLPVLNKLLVTFDSKFTKSTVLVNLFPSSAPKVTIAKDLLFIKFETEAELSAHMPDGKKYPVMTVDIDLEATTTVEITNEKIILQLSKLTPKANVKVSHIGIIPLHFLNVFLEQVINLSLPVMNNKLKKGFPLPNVSNVIFPNASIRMLPGYLSVSSDIIYQP